MKPKPDWISRWVAIELCGMGGNNVWVYAGNVPVRLMIPAEIIDSLRRAERAARKGKGKP